MKYDKQTIEKWLRQNNPRTQEPASEAEIASAENQLCTKFSASYRWFLREFGAASWPDYILGLGNHLPPGQNVVYITIRERKAVEPKMPNTLIPISPDGWGNHYCLDTAQNNNNECPIVIWDHELSVDQIPEQKYSSFLDWLAEQIDQRLEMDM